MAHQAPTDRLGTLDRLTTTFQVGAHTLRVWKVTEGRWTVAVDAGEASDTYATQAEAWEAGVRTAARLDDAASPRGS